MRNISWGWMISRLLWKSCVTIHARCCCFPSTCESGFPGGSHSLELARMMISLVLLQTKDKRWMHDHDGNITHQLGKAYFRTSWINCGCMEYVTTQMFRGDSSACLMSALKHGRTYSVNLDVPWRQQPAVCTDTIVLSKSRASNLTPFETREPTNDLAIRWSFAAAFRFLLLFPMVQKWCTLYPDIMKEHSQGLRESLRRSQRKRRSTRNILLSFFTSGCFALIDKKYFWVIVRFISFILRPVYIIPYNNNLIIIWHLMVFWLHAVQAWKAS